VNHLTAQQRCIEVGCDRPIKARGLCVRCYARLRRSDPARPACAVKGCDDRAVTFGWCPRHYTRWLRHGSPSIVRDRTSHGHCRGASKSPTHNSWDAMIASCSRPSSKGWEYCGGRGVTVCERWRGVDGFENFLVDMGERPPGRILGRVDPDGDYEPANCRWATREGQQAARLRGVAVRRREEAMS
jgi:hypothetical protein